MEQTSRTYVIPYIVSLYAHLLLGVDDADPELPVPVHLGGQPACRILPGHR